MTPLDTSPAANRVHLDLLRQPGSGRRTWIAAELSEAVREISRAGIRARDPKLTEAEVNRELLRILYGRTGSPCR